MNKLQTQEEIYERIERCEDPTTLVEEFHLARALGYLGNREDWYNIGILMLCRVHLLTPETQLEVYRSWDANDLRWALSQYKPEVYTYTQTNRETFRFLCQLGVRNFEKRISGTCSYERWVQISDKPHLHCNWKSSKNTARYLMKDYPGFSTQPLVPMVAAARRMGIKLPNGVAALIFGRVLF
jgi:hypothetical protein